AAGLVGEPLGREVVLREAALAHALDRKLEAAAAVAALAGEGDVRVALAEVDGGGEAGVARWLPLAHVELARAQIAVVAAHRPAAREVPGDAAPRAELLELRRRAEGERLGAVAVGRGQPPLAGARLRERRGEQQRGVGAAGMAEAAEQRILEPLARSPQARATPARLRASCACTAARATSPPSRRARSPRSASPSTGP